MAISLNAPLAQVRAWVKAKRQEGVTCPACSQFVKVYKRKLNAGMAMSLLTMYRLGKTEFIHIPTMIGARSREEGKLAYWGLVEEADTARPDGGRAGYWRVTPLGELFVQGKCGVPQYAHVFNGKCLGLEGDDVTIQDALGDQFDYTELMSA